MIQVWSDTGESVCTAEPGSGLVAQAEEAQGPAGDYHTGIL